AVTRHRLVQNARSRPNSKTASLHPECKQICAVHAPAAYTTTQPHFHVNGWAPSPWKLKTRYREAQRNSQKKPATNIARMPSRKPGLVIEIWSHAIAPVP